MENILPYLYLLRVPLLGWLVVTLLAPLSASPGSRLNAMVSGMFDLTFWGTFWVAVAGAMASTTFGVCALMTFHAGYRRVGLKPPHDWFGERPSLGKLAAFTKYLGWKLEKGMLAVGGFALVPLISLVAGVFYASGNWWSPLAPCGIAALVFFAMFLVGALGWRVELGGLRALSARLLKFSPAGYLNSNGELLPGHGFAMGLTSIFLFFYLACGYFTWVRLQGPVEPWVNSILPKPPTLAFLLILVSLLVWLLSAVTFFFDRFRVPIVLAFSLYVIATSATQQADHHFGVSKTHPKSLTPREVIIGDGIPNTPIIVCASGGGIQAGVWTTKVLSELEREFPSRFGKSVRLISAVSGGSLGAMFFAAAQGEGKPLLAFERAIESRPETLDALDAVGWGMVYPDLLRVLFPPLIPKTIDRGWAIERAWNLAGRLPNRLGDWREDVRTGRRPALLLNATIIETGHRLVFPTFDFDTKPSLWNTKLPQSFYGLFKDAQGVPVIYDLPVTTAVRLSATFPYVTPVARVDADLPQSQRYHFADGGYYDNFGVSSAINFLDLAFAGDMKDKPDKPRNVMLLEIRDRRSRDSIPSASGGQGWLFQFTAPLDGIMNVRDTAQRERNSSEIALLYDALAHRGVTLHHAVFESPRDKVPLSWHLTRAQKAAFYYDWDSRFAVGKVQREQVDAVKAFLDLGTR